MDIVSESDQQIQIDSNLGNEGKTKLIALYLFRSKETTDLFVGGEGDFGY